MGYLFTSESVSEGHPDKVADQENRLYQRRVYVREQFVWRAFRHS